MKKIIALLCVLSIIAAAYLYLNNYIEENLEAVDLGMILRLLLKFPQGSTTNDIAEILFENNLISNIRVFRSIMLKRQGQMLN